MSARIESPTDVDEVTLYNKGSLNIIVHGYQVPHINSIRIISEGNKAIIIIDKPDNVIVKNKDRNILRQGLFYKLVRKLKKKKEKTDDKH